MPLPLTKPPSRLPPEARVGERLAALNRHMLKIQAKPRELLTHILDIEFFNVEHLLREHLLLPVCDQTHSYRPKLFSCFSSVSLNNNYHPTVTPTPEGLLVFGGIENRAEPKKDWFMLIARPSLNRHTSQMEYKEP